MVWPRARRRFAAGLISMAAAFESPMNVNLAAAAGAAAGPQRGQGRDDHREEDRAASSDP